jgi:hypothetical protein
MNKLNSLTFGCLIFTCLFSLSSIAQTKKRTTSGRSSAGQSAVSLSNVRLDACMQKNRQLTEEKITLNSQLVQANGELNANKNNSIYYQSLLKVSRDSLRATQLQSKRIEDENKAQLMVMSDSLAILRDFREKVMIEKQAVANDPNVIRVYDFPADIVRIKMLRKFLDEGTGITLEKNTDDGFSISKIYKDRIRKSGLGKKTIDSKVECAIKMAPHPFNSDRTMFYATTTVQERVGKKPFEDIADKAMTKDYEQKVLKFFDTFLTK